MPAADGLAGRIRAARRRPLFATASLPTVSLGPEAIEAHLPHREPMRLLEAVCGLDPATGRAWGRRVLSPDDRAFAGHFPGRPVYPGVLQIESVGQLALFAAMRRRGETSGVRLTRVIEAAFLAEVVPGSTLDLLSDPIEDDGFVLTSLGQVVVGDTIVCACAFEAIWSD